MQLKNVSLVVLLLVAAILVWCRFQYEQAAVEVAKHTAELLKKENELLRGELKDKCLVELPASAALDDDNNSVSWFTPVFVVGGFVLLGHFIISEVLLARKTLQENRNDTPFTWMELVAYRVDYWFSTSVVFKPAALIAGTFILIVIGGVLLALVAGVNFSSGLWVSWTFVADPGTHADQKDTGARAVSFLLTIGGMLVFALVIGIVSEEISERVDSLRKGKSRVIESGHTLILGWSDKTLAIIKELAVANESEGGGVIVVMAEKEKDEMEGLIDELGKDALRGSIIVVRSGCPILMGDLNKVSARTAKAIIVLSDQTIGADESDARSVRTMLSLTGLGEKVGHCVVEMCDIDNRELVQLVGGADVETMVAHDIIGRLMIQCACQPGLSQVMESLLGFQGSEFYLKAWPELVGLTFGEVMFRFADAVPVGYKPMNGPPILNPPDSVVIGEGDEIMVLAEDDDSYEVNDQAIETSAVTIPEWQPEDVGPQNILFCGWRRDMTDMIKELDMTVPPGSKLWLMSALSPEERHDKMSESGRQGEQGLENLSIIHHQGNPTLRRNLELLPLEAFDSVLILADENEGADMQTADSRSLATLLLVRDIRNQRARIRRGELVPSRRGAAADINLSFIWRDRPCTIISEVLDPRTRALIAVANVGDYVMSNEIVSSAIAQVAERREMNTVLSELLTAVGNETYLKDVQLYLHVGEELNFWDLVARARSRGEICIGWKRLDESPELNPENKLTKRRWAAGDMVVVIAED